MMRGPTRAWRDGADVDAGQVTFRRAIGTGSERPLGKHATQRDSKKGSPEQRQAHGGKEQATRGAR